MVISIARRLFNALLVLWVISIIAFWLSQAVPGDPIMDYISIDENRISTNPAEQRRAYERIARSRGMDLPAFYATINIYPDSIRYIFPEEDKKAVKNWIRESKDVKGSLALYQALRHTLVQNCDKLQGQHKNEVLCSFINISLSNHDYRQIYQQAQSLSELEDVANIIEKSGRLIHSAEPKKSMGPEIRWHGSANQYHRWISGLLYQRPLTSLTDGRNAWPKIFEALRWTLLVNGLALILALIAGIRIGIWSAKKDGVLRERITSWILFALFALPSFWLGTLLIYFLASGEWFSIFPSGGLGRHLKADNALEALWNITYHITLPVLCLAAGALAYISRQVKHSVLFEYGKPYVPMLRAHGISEKTILHKHVLKNSLFPVITMTGGAIPALLSGSLVIEVIFSIPGMGRLMYSSILARDWPVVFPILMLAALVTILSYMITDLMYMYADPRVKIADYV